MCKSCIEEEEVSNETYFYNDDSQGAINELFNECKILNKTVPMQKKQILSLEENKDTKQNVFEVEKQKQNFT